MKYSVPVELESVLAAATREYNASGTFFLSREYLTALHAKTNAFPRSLEQVIWGAEEIARDSDAACYALFLCRAMEHRELFMTAIKEIVLPDGDFPFLAILAFAPYIDQLYDRLKAKDLPADIIDATVGQFEECMFLYEERCGRLGMNMRYFDHMQRYLDFKILNIGRLRFELHVLKDACMVESRKTGKQILFPVSGEMNAHGLLADTPPIDKHANSFSAFFRETEDSFIGTPVNKSGRCEREPITLDKREYFLRLPLYSNCLSVHIPARGALTREACEASYKRAMEIFPALYPDTKFLAFRCHSWMMSPELQEILRPGSNLLEFQEPYLKYPCKTRGEDIFNFVFKTTPCELSTLPEDTSLQRALKERYLAGGYLYEYNGIFTV